MVGRMNGYIDLFTMILKIICFFLPKTSLAQMLPERVDLAPQCNFLIFSAQNDLKNSKNDVKTQKLSPEINLKTKSQPRNEIKTPTNKMIKFLVLFVLFIFWFFFDFSFWLNVAWLFLEGLAL